MGQGADHPMNVGITYDLQSDFPEIVDNEHAAEFDVPETIDAICDALERLGR